MPPEKVINTELCMNSPSLFARMTWQVLFSYYRENNGDLDKMDSLLCDLAILERFFKNKTDVVIYWEFDQNGYTDLRDYEDGYSTARIIKGDRKIIVEFLK